MEQNLATTQELKDVETRLSHEISNVRVDIRELESRMTIKLGSMLVLSIGIMTALSKI